MRDPIFRRSDGVWLNEPKRWSTQGEGLRIVTDKATDFWCETHYGFTRDSGHFLGFPTADAFTAELRVQGDFHALYDQAGIMVRIDAHHWVKAGIELSDGRAMLASVLTDGRSDWATAPYEHDAGDFWVRATVCERRTSLAGLGRWQTLAAHAAGAIRQGNILSCGADGLHTRADRVERHLPDLPPDTRRLARIFTISADGGGHRLRIWSTVRI